MLRKFQEILDVSSRNYETLGSHFQNFEFSRELIDNFRINFQKFGRKFRRTFGNLYENFSNFLIINREIKRKTTTPF